MITHLHSPKGMAHTNTLVPESGIVYHLTLNPVAGTNLIIIACIILFLVGFPFPVFFLFFLHYLFSCM